MINPDDLTENEGIFQEQLCKGHFAGVSCSEQIRMEEATTWGPERTIRASFIRRLCTDPDMVKKIQPTGIRIRGARIDGSLDLNSLDIPFNISLLECFIPHTVNLRRATVNALDLSGSHTVSIDADSLNVSGDMRLADGFSAHGSVCLTGAKIKGDLICVKGNFDNKNVQKETTGINGCGDCRASTLYAYALILERTNIEGSLKLCGGFSTNGGVNLIDATIGMNLNGTKGAFSAKIVGENLVVKNSGRRLACEADTELHLNCAFNGEGMHIKRNFILNCVDFKGEVRLTGASIDGDLESAEGKYINPKGNSIHADRLRVRGNIYFNDDFKADGVVRLPRAEIGADLSFCSATLQSDKENTLALYCEGIKVNGAVYMRNIKVNNGYVDFSFSTIGGNLDCADGKFLNTRGWSIRGNGMDIKGSAFLSTSGFGGSFEAEGLVSLTGTKLGMDLICTNGSFKSSVCCVFEDNTPCAVKADNMFIGGKVEMNKEGFRAEGGVNFNDSTIGSFLNCDHGTFIAPPLGGNFKCAMSAGKLQVGGSMYLGEKFTANGQVMLNDASIGRNLCCSDGIMDNEVGFALRAMQLRVAGTVYFDKNFISRGEVRINYATIGGNLDCSGGTFINNKDKSEQDDLDDERGKHYALCADGVRIQGSVCFRHYFHVDGIVSLQNADIGMRLIWKDIKDQAKVSLYLDSAKVGVLEDDENSWPDKNNLQINGFEYEFLKDLSPKGLKSRRKKWLKRPHDFRIQPFEHLASVLRRSGYEEDSKMVLIEKNEMWSNLTIRWPWTSKCHQYQSPLTRIHMFMLKYLVCYGYKPIRALYIGLAAVLIGWGLFWVGFENGLMIPTKDKDKVFIYQTATIQSVKENIELKKIKKGFGLYSLIYSFDTFLPVIDFHTRDYWLPTAKQPSEFSREPLSPAWLKNSVENKDGFLNKVGLVLCVYRWFLKIVGWVVTSIFIAAMTGIVRR